LAKAHPQPLIEEFIILITLRDPGREVSDGPEETGAFRERGVMAGMPQWRKSVKRPCQN
jgi:hypothetical protein